MGRSSFSETPYQSNSSHPGSAVEPLFRCFLLFLSIVLVVLTFPCSLFFCIQIVQEYERIVVFRLGRMRTDISKKPGLLFVLPCVDDYWKLDLRTITFDVPYQEVLSKDSVTVYVDAVIYYRVEDVKMAIANVQNWERCTQLLAASALRNVLGTHTLSELLSERNAISVQIRGVLDEATKPWGIWVERVEMKDVRLPGQLQRAMAAEAEATREAKAKVIAAQGEQKAARSMREAAQVMAESNTALQLRFLQTLTAVSAEKNQTVVLPLPVDLLLRMAGAKAK